MNKEVKNYRKFIAYEDIMSNNEIIKNIIIILLLLKI